MPSPTPLPVLVTNNGTDWWAQLLDGLLGAALSAVLAAAVSFIIARYVLTKTLASERQNAAEERRAASAALREQIGISAAARLLDLLAELEVAWSHAMNSSSFGGMRSFGYDGPTKYDAHRVLRAAVLSDAQQLHEAEARRRVEALLGLAEFRNRERDYDRGRQARERNLEDFLAYERHVRDTLVALIRGDALPAAVATPQLAPDSLPGDDD